MTFEQWKEQSISLSQRADRISRMIVARARKLADQGGLDGSMPFHLAHNAMCGLEYGHPWREVNYSLARKVLWLEKKSWEPSRIANRISSRLYKQIV